MKKALLILSLLCAPFLSLAQENSTYPVQGRVTASADGQALVGASIVIKGTTTGTITDKDGSFRLELPAGENLLTISFIGFTSRDVAVSVPVTKPLSVTLEEDIFALGEVQVVSTGYQQLPKERATGSFVQLDNELLNRSISTNILNRLEGITSGLIFNRNPADPISIRGRSTLFADAEPLVIVDNFPYEGDINNINPNDVESITILKDAAAASIWGARAGNGVIVITTKQGENGQVPTVSFNSNVTIGESPDAFYVPRMSVNDYIDTELALFESGYYTSLETSLSHRVLSPVVELLIAERDGKITSKEARARIAALREHDVRRDFDDYLYRQSVNQQYAVSIRGGGERQRYFLSAGYDHNRHNLVGNQFSRITLNAQNTWSFFDDKLRLSGDFYYVQSKEQNNGISPSSLRLSSSSQLPPYTKLADEHGHPAIISQQYRVGFLDEAEANGLLNWRYSPLKEIGLNDKSSRMSDYRANFGVNYQVVSGLDATLRYQYWYSQVSDRDYFPEESYYARDLINRFTQVGDDGNLERPVPIGGILDLREQWSYSHSFRAQLNYSKRWDRHEISAMGGYEVKAAETRANSTRYYGYDNDLANSAPVDHVTHYTAYHYPYSILSIPDNENHVYLTDRFISYFANASYAYDRRYMLSLSARKDQSNLFGVDANQRGVPLWSAGLSWNINEEAFYHSEWLPFLKLRATYGYSGNIDKSLTAYTTARIMGNSFTTGLLYGKIINPPNPRLQWERVAMQNLGLEFATKNQRMSGSIEYFAKQGYDLIGFAPLSPTTGQTEFMGNTAETDGHGMDIALATINIDKAFQWRTDWLFSTVDINVSDYKREEESLRYLLEYGDNGNSPQEGKPLFVIYSYPWAGLDPLTGDPRGFLNGEASTEHATIMNNATVDSLIFHGPARPTAFGALRNTFTWKNLSLAVNITYRLGYYFRRKSIDYMSDRGLGGHGDYDMRWQQPGDEAFTDVPSIPDTPNSYRDDFYRLSEVLVEKGDHVRLQDISLAYTLDRTDIPGLPFRRAQVYCYARNLGILWKATDEVPDPDYLDINALRSYAIGLRVNF